MFYNIFMLSLSIEVVHVFPWYIWRLEPRCFLLVWWLCHLQCVFQYLWTLQERLFYLVIYRGLQSVNIIKLVYIKGNYKSYATELLVKNNLREVHLKKISNQSPGSIVKTIPGSSWVIFAICGVSWTSCPKKCDTWCGQNL